MSTTPHQSGAPGSEPAPSVATGETPAVARTRPVVPATAWPVLVLGVAVAVLAELIRKRDIPVPGMDKAYLTILPMVFALVIGAVISIQRVKPLSLHLQKVANAFLGVGVMYLVARLAFNIGPGMPTIIKAGPALFLQEVGHLLGTIALALPLAVALKMGKATIGATFSLDREPAFAMVNEKYGPDSDQYRGVLAMYVFGTLFGAIYITLLTSVICALGWFDPKALAMGAGVGSGSMMAASLGSITAAYPEAKADVAALGAASNLITTVLGVYVGIYLALPLADKFYRVLTRHRDAASEDIGAGLSEEENRSFREQVAAAAEQVSLPVWLSIPVITVIGILTACVTLWASGKPVDVGGVLAGYAIIDALILVSMALHRAVRPVSTIIWVTTIGAFISSQWMFFGWGPQIAKLVANVDFLSIATVCLTFAGLSIGKDVPLLRKIGWKIIPVGLVAITASFVLAAIIAEFSLGLWHV